RPYWVESRPAERGRNVIASLAPDGSLESLALTGFDVRSRVHEYGGTPFVLDRGAIYFCNFADQRLYRWQAGESPHPFTPEGYRYADFDADPLRERLFCVREDHTHSGEPKNAIVALDERGTDGGVVLFGASDFVAYPRVSPDGRRLAWIGWNHPDMPWDATILYTADLDDGRLTGITAVAGGPRESVLEPRWSPDGALYFISDRSGWWNLYRLRGGVERVFAIEAELAGALWTLGQSSYVLTGDGRAVFRYSVEAQDRLGVVELDSGQWRTVSLPLNALSNLQLLSRESVVAVAASSMAEPALVSIDVRTGDHKVLRTPSELTLAADFVSAAEPISFPASAGAAHAFYYPPRNPDFTAPEGERSPLIVKVHGGPTSHAKPELGRAVQFWTTRGFAFLDVNHGGSTGFGRAYRERLNGEWGVVDVEDVIAAVRYLVQQRHVDSDRIAIRGGSAGGFTVLAALAFHDVFKAGANYYGVSDLEMLARDTHKFESRYLDRLVAPLPAGRAIYEARAPVKHLGGFKAPLITFQGAEDKVVPPEQSRAIVCALREKGVLVEYVEFEGEQHGFRKADSIVRSLEAELDFYLRVFNT
ncbi:MAG: S9 family peptidase, partial [Steroidobacteraceae bacterium]